MSTTRELLIDNLTDQIEMLKLDIKNLKEKNSRLTNNNMRLQERLYQADISIEALYAENDALIHTPQFAVDTEGAFDRGRQDGIRSLSSTTNNYLYAMAEETIQAMNQIVNKYTRDLALTMFLGTVEPEELVNDLPETDFTAELLANALKMS